MTVIRKEDTGLTRLQGSRSMQLIPAWKTALLWISHRWTFWAPGKELLHLLHPPVLLATEYTLSFPDSQWAGPEGPFQMPSQERSTAAPDIGISQGSILGSRPLGKLTPPWAHLPDLGSVLTGQIRWELQLQVSVFLRDIAGWLPATSLLVPLWTNAISCIPFVSCRHHTLSWTPGCHPTAVPRAHIQRSGTF